MGAGRGVAVLAVAVAIAAPAAVSAPRAVAEGAGGLDPGRFEAAVDAVLDLPYQPAAAPTGVDTAFGADDFPAAFPATDTSTGTCCAGPVPDQPPLADLAPPFADWPEGFEQVELASADGTPLHAHAAITPGAPGVVVMHGFNTNGRWSVVRYAAALHANGFSVIAPDHRDMGREWERGGSWHPDGTRHGQSLGWKEAQDLLAAAAHLRDRGTARIGVLGFSEGAQNTLLALGQDLDGLVDAVLTFSGPADQATLGQRNAASTAALLTTVVNEPDVCRYLERVGQGEEFAATPNFMLRHDSAVDTLDGVVGAGVDPSVPGLHLYAQDDELVPAWNAVALASRTSTLAAHETLLVESGNHAYFYDRWWTQAAALSWFRTWLDPEGRTTATPTVAQPVGGAPLRDQVVDLSDTTRAEGDAELRDRDACPPAAEPVGPTVLLSVQQDGAEVVVDGRRSWSGWDDHRVAAWTLDLGDGSPVVRGDEVTTARVAHAYAPGTWTLRMTVEDDTGRTASATRTVGVAAVPGPTGPAPEPAPSTPPSDDAATAAPPLPATGGGGAAVAVAMLVVAATAPRRRGGRSSAGGSPRPVRR